MEKSGKKDQNLNDSALAINLDDEEEDSNSLIQITLLSGNEFEVDYCQILKYSQLIKDYYPFDKAKTELSQLFQNYQRQYEIEEKKINLFFTLIQEKNVYLTIDNCFDLLKIAKLFEVKKLELLINKYRRIHQKDVDFLSQLLIQQYSNKYEEIFKSFDPKNNIENELTEQIENCLKSKYFAKLTISSNHRMIENSDRNSFSSDSLYRFIKEKIEERYVLFSFIDLQTLSDENFRELAIGFRENNSKIYYDYFKFDFEYLCSLKEDKNELRRRLEILLGKNQELDSANKELINLNEKIQSKIEKIESEKEKLQAEKEQIQSEKEKIDSQKEKIESEIEKLQTENEEFQGQNEKLK